VDANLLRERAAIVRALRGVLSDEGFIEVEASVLVDGPALEENIEALPARGGWLHTSPEFALKRAVASGLWRVYAVSEVFRGEELGRHHAEEFTMLELYAAGFRYLDLIPLVERLVAAAFSAVRRGRPEFARTTVAALFGGRSPEDDEAFFRRWVEEIDPRLQKPTWVLDFPARHAALAEVRGDVSERLELYLGGLELGNGYSELRDGAELRERFERSAAVRSSRGQPPHPVDQGVIAATARMPRCAGIAIGLDRLVMAALGVEQIRSVRLERR
jgi:lysyl-tRNA synthetase class 2